MHRAARGSPASATRCFGPQCAWPASKAHLRGGTRHDPRTSELPWSAHVALTVRSERDRRTPFTRTPHATKIAEMPAQNARAGKIPALWRLLRRGRRPKVGAESGPEQSRPRRKRVKVLPRISAIASHAVGGRGIAPARGSCPAPARSPTPAAAAGSSGESGVRPPANLRAKALCCCDGVSRSSSEARCGQRSMPTYPSLTSSARPASRETRAERVGPGGLPAVQAGRAIACRAQTHFDSVLVS